MYYVLDVDGEENGRVKLTTPAEAVAFDTLLLLRRMQTELRVLTKMVGTLSATDVDLLRKEIRKGEGDEPVIVKRIREPKKKDAEKGERLTEPAPKKDEAGTDIKETPDG